MAHVITRLKWSDNDKVSRIYSHYNDFHTPYRYQSMKVFRHAEDPDVISLLFHWDSSDDMEEFMKDPTVKEVMTQTSANEPETFPLRKKTG